MFKPMMRKTMLAMIGMVLMATAADAHFRKRCRSVCYDECRIAGNTLSIDGFNHYGYNGAYPPIPQQPFAITNSNLDGPTGSQYLKVQVYASYSNGGVAIYLTDNSGTGGAFKRYPTVGSATAYPQIGGNGYYYNFQIPANELYANNALSANSTSPPPDQVPYIYFTYSPQ